MRSHREIRDELLAAHGQPTRLPDDVEGQVLAFAHSSRESAEAFAAADVEWFGHPAYAELRESIGWVSVVDLRPAIAQAAAQWRG